MNKKHQANQTWPCLHCLVLLPFELHLRFGCLEIGMVGIEGCFLLGSCGSNPTVRGRAALQKWRDIRTLDRVVSPLSWVRRHIKRTSLLRGLHAVESERCCKGSVFGLLQCRSLWGKVGLPQKPNLGYGLGCVDSTCIHMQLYYTYVYTYLHIYTYINT